MDRLLKVKFEELFDNGRTSVRTRQNASGRNDVAAATATVATFASRPNKVANLPQPF
jgi:hypothetical protein